MKRWFRFRVPGRSSAGATLGGEYPDDFLLDYRRLRRIALENRDRYQGARPYPHLMIEDLISAATLEQVLSAFPQPAAPLNWRRTLARDPAGQPAQSGKLGFGELSELAPVIRQLIWELNSSSFIRCLETLTGIDNLLPDPVLRGGGLHQILRGGVLGVHADFTRHADHGLDRRINVLLYLNRDWKDEYQGHLELWDRALGRCVQRFRPSAGRCVIFNTDADSFHGHPRPLACPEGMTRKSIALYYYTLGRAGKAVEPTGSTDWRVLPDIELPELQ